jgi:uncharacterized protein (TIGR03085 family)
MTSSTVVRAERDALCRLFLEVGPDAPTLCAGWTAADLAAHLVVREHNPLAGPGILLPGPFARYTERAQSRTKSAHPFEVLVARIRSGPPLAWRPFDTMFNLNEYFVHHEDVRRAGGDTTPRPPEGVAALEDALWHTLRRGAGLLTRRMRGTGLDLERENGEIIHAHKGSPVATLSGRPGEIVLFLMGRKGASCADVGGPPSAAEELRSASFGI